MPGLEALGHEVRTSELHRGSLAADTAAVQADVDALGDAVVCGHSYGGAVITGLRPDGIRRLVYLAALMPDVGQSGADLNQLGPPSSLQEALVMGDDGTCTVDVARAADVFYADCELGDQAAAVARL
nr:alpha/beta hydrolase [Micromonospora sp. DSM 115978]